MAVACPSHISPICKELSNTVDRTAVNVTGSSNTKFGILAGASRLTRSQVRVSKIRVRVSEPYGIKRAIISAWPQNDCVVRAIPKEGATSTVVAQEVEFVWAGPGDEVLLTADFLNWETKLPLTRTDKGLFQLKQKLAPGSYSYKFIVDGVWQHSPDRPTVADGAGGFNNVMLIAAGPAASPAAPAAAPVAAAAADSPAPKAAPAGKAAGKAAGKKAGAKAIGASMAEDIIPQLSQKLEEESGLSDLTLTFSEDQLRGSFLKGGVPYAFWCYFPDGKLEGSRGFSLATHGGQPSTVEPFLIDEKKITPDLVVFWVLKRLFAQKLLSLN